MNAEQILKERIAETESEIKRLEEWLLNFGGDDKGRDRRIMNDIKTLKELRDLSQNLYYRSRGLQ